MTVLERPAVRRRAVGGWVAIGAALLVVGAVAAAIAGIARLPAQGLLDPDAAGPDGGRALVQILRGQGVDVTVARSREAAVTAAGADTTLVVTDATVLSDADLTALADAAEDVVLIDPRARDLRVLFEGAAPRGIGDGAAEPACPVAEARRAGTISPGPVFTAPAGVTGCYPSGAGYGLLVHTTDTGRLAAVDGTALFLNEHLATAGNAALALGLMGRHADLVWYLPDPLADGDGKPATIGTLTPEWVTPAIALAVLAALAAAVWRGRRFGPLVAETLPVTVRGAETTAGRARLYARAGDPGHAIDALRIAALQRLAHRLGLGPAASAPEISAAVAAQAGIDPRIAAEILIDRVPRTDRELVDLSDRLHDLEHAATERTRL